MIQHIFKGWYLGDVEFDFNSELKENITLVAKWEEKVTNNKDTNNGGSVGGGSSKPSQGSQLKYGDTDCNGTINSVDAMLVSQYVEGSKTLNE